MGVQAIEYSIRKAEGGRLKGPESGPTRASRRGGGFRDALEAFSPQGHFRLGRVRRTSASRFSPRTRRCAGRSGSNRTGCRRVRQLAGVHGARRASAGLAAGARGGGSNARGSPRSSSSDASTRSRVSSSSRCARSRVNVWSTPIASMSAPTAVIEGSTAPRWMRPKDAASAELTYFVEASTTNEAARANLIEFPCESHGPPVRGGHIWRRLLPFMLRGLLPARRRQA